MLLLSGKDSLRRKEWYQEAVYPLRNTRFTGPDSQNGQECQKRAKVSKVAFLSKVQKQLKTACNGCSHPSRPHCQQHRLSGGPEEQKGREERWCTGEYTPPALTGRARSVPLGPTAQPWDHRSTDINVDVTAAPRTPTTVRSDGLLGSRSQSVLGSGSWAGLDSSFLFSSDRSDRLRFPDHHRG